MATVSLISVQVTDDSGRTANAVFPVLSTMTVAQIQAYVNTMLPNLDTVTGAKITGVSVNLGLSLPGGLKASAIADTPVQWGANFGFSAANTAYRHTIRVPALDQGLIIAGEIDTTPAYVQNWLTNVITGDGTVAPTDKYGNDLTALLAAEATFHK